MGLGARALLVRQRIMLINALRGHMAEFPSGAWAKALLERRPARLASVALANKTARIAWALLAKGEPCRGAAQAA